MPLLFLNYNSMKIDMHFHSTASDGYSTKEELILQAKSLWVDFLALTDHDIVSHGFQELARHHGIQSCDSVEISTNNKEHNKSLHLTLYAREISQEIAWVLSNVIRSKTFLIEKQVEFFNLIGFDIDKIWMFQFFELQGRKRESLNKFDICSYMYRFPHNVAKAYEVNAGEAIPLEEFYQKFLKKWGENYEQFAVRIGDYETSLEDAHRYRKQVDGILSLAHPHVTFKKWLIEEFESVLPYYVENGVNAIEINSKATKEWIDAILKAKERFGLYLTFGSDNHKMGHSDNKHGEFGEVNSYFAGSDLVEKYFSEYKTKLWY